MTTPRRYYFGVTVAPGFRESAAGRNARHGYYYSVAAALLLAGALDFALPPAGLWVTVFLPLLTAGAAFFHARARVQRFSAPPVSMREAEVSRGPERLPRWTALGVLPFLLLLAAGIYLRAHWTDIPASFPVHWGADGQPNRWVSRTPQGVYGPLEFGACVLLLLLGAGVATFYGARRSPLREAMLKIMLGAAYFTAFIFALIGLLPLHVFSPLAFLIPLPAFVIGVLIYAFRVSSDPDMSGELTPDSCWHLSPIYYNPADPALFVQKRIGLGYTLNLGNRLSWWFAGAILALIPCAILLLR